MRVCRLPSVALCDSGAETPARSCRSSGRIISARRKSASCYFAIPHSQNIIFLCIGDVVAFAITSMSSGKMGSRLGLYEMGLKPSTEVYAYGRVFSNASAKAVHH